MTGPEKLIDMFEMTLLNILSIALILTPADWWLQFDNIESRSAFLLKTILLITAIAANVGKIIRYYKNRKEQKRNEP